MSGRDGDALLGFPVADVAPGTLVDAGSSTVFEDGRTARVLRIEGGDARDVAWCFDESDASTGELVVFDHRHVVVEILDPMEGADPGDVTAKRFPFWGDASDLVEILDVKPRGKNHFLSVVRGHHVRPVVEGSQMIGQAIVAAGRLQPERRPVSAHMAFFRSADATMPLLFRVEELSSGRTFTTLSVVVSQAGRRCAAGSVLLDVTTADLVRHAVEAPKTPGPYESQPVDMSVTGRDIRVVDGAYSGDPEAVVGPPLIDAWVRFRELPDDPPLHAGLVAQFTGHMSIAAALRPHAGIGQDQAHRSISTAINAISMSFHSAVHADRWLLYRHLSTFAGDGMTHSECRVHDERGAMLASFSVDAMVRAFSDPTVPHDERTAL